MDDSWAPVLLFRLFCKVDTSLRTHLDGDFFGAGCGEGLGQIDRADVFVAVGFPVVLFFGQIADHGPRGVIGKFLRDACGRQGGAGRDVEGV